jgi:hypothetical protein
MEKNKIPQIEVAKFKSRYFNFREEYLEIFFCFCKSQIKLLVKENKNNRGSHYLGQQNAMYWGSSAHMCPCCYDSHPYVPFAIDPPTPIRTSPNCVAAKP